MNIRLLLVQPESGGRLDLPPETPCDVRHAATHDDVLDALTRWQPDCLLLDLDLPLLMKDIFFCYWRTLPGRTRLIDVVAEGRESDASARAHALLVIPSTPAELQARLDCLVGALLGWRSEAPTPAAS